MTDADHTQPGDGERHLPELPSRLVDQEAREEAAERSPAVADTIAEALRLLPNLVKLVYRLLRDSRVPVRGRAFALAALAYVVSPVDLVPDFIPGLGQTDDLFVVVLALHHLLRRAGDDVVAEHWDGSGEVLDLVDGVLAVAADVVPLRLRAAVRRIVR